MQTRLLPILHVAPLGNRQQRRHLGAAVCELPGRPPGAASVIWFFRLAHFPVCTSYNFLLKTRHFK